MKHSLVPVVVPATQIDCPVVQKMWPFYVYDLGRACEFPRDWVSPTDPSFIPDDVTPYFNDPDKKPFLIRVNDALAGFALVSTSAVLPDIDFYLNEFFIVGKFQHQGVGQLAAFELFNQLRGRWAVGILPENKSAVTFWRKIIKAYTADHFSEFSKTSKAFKSDSMVIFTFDHGVRS